MIPPEARGAWRDIAARLRPYVARRLRNPADVDDVVQETLVKVHQGVGTLDDGERFGAWVYRIAERSIADAMRARARLPLAAAPDAIPDHSADSAEATDLQSELGECVAVFVARLPSPYREAITLTELQGLTQKDAAETVGVSLSGMKSRVQRGRERILAMFQECCDISLDCRGRVMQCDPRTPIVHRLASKL
ncbi:MAG: sigma-70 family RNA polymerase sigma factor [Polyangia bacterium]